MKALVVKQVQKTVGAPTLWLGLGVVAVCASLGLSYSRAQLEAEHAMMMRAGPPSPVAIADAVPAAVGEGHVIARFDAERAVTVKVGPAGNRADWLAVPLFPAAGAAAPAASGPVPPRARPADDAPRLERAAGLALFPPGSTPEALLPEGARVFEGALNGPLLPLEVFGLDTAAALAEAGIALPADFVALRPWVGGRAAALALPAATPLPRTLFWAGLFAVLVAVGLSMRPERGDRYLTIRPDEVERRIVTRSRIMADTDRFNPLIGQDDIRRGAMERLHARERAEGRTPSTFVTTTPTGTVGSGWVRNRR